ncbi:MAG: DUF1826 domain-containing protein [Bacteroidota bacterium]
MKTLTLNKNWAIGSFVEVLESIHQKEVNIAIYERDIQHLSSEIDPLLDENIQVRSSGNPNTILEKIREETGLGNDALIVQDIDNLLQHFKKISGSKSFRLLLAVVESNMCRRFHTDVNDIRMLCTYKGQGTLWLTEDNINRKALDTGKENETIVIDENEIKQAKTGSVVLLKGAIYPKEETKAIVHRSPTIEEYGEKRLLLRIDTNEFLNF